MAINIKNYVDISTTFPSANVAGRSFGGLVFTGKDTKPGVELASIKTSQGAKQVKSDLYDAWEIYNKGGVVFLTLDEVGRMFGKGGDIDEQGKATEPSDEYKFAQNYYGYISPSGRFASRLAFAKVCPIYANGDIAGDVILETEIIDEGGRKIEVVTRCEYTTERETPQGGTESPTGYETPNAAFVRVNMATNLFGSFTFLSLPSGSESSTSEDVTTDIDLQQLKDVALTNQGLDTKYLFVVNRMRGESLASDVVTESEELSQVKGTVYLSGATDVSAYMPMAILGSTDYANGQVVNFMFKQFATEEPTVYDDATYTAFNQANINFYGRTQTNGQTLDFYQRGFNIDGTDTAVYCNEMWFKAICETALIDLLVSRERLSADALGVDLVKLEVIDCCSDAIKNGMFMRKDLSTKDVRNVREIVVHTGGDETDVGSIEADISSKGYSVYAYLTEMQDANKLGKETEKIIVYYVFYGTADSVRYIKGNDILLK